MVQLRNCWFDSFKIKLTAYHRRAEVWAFCIPAEVSLQFSYHPSVDKVNHLKGEKLLMKDVDINNL